MAAGNWIAAVLIFWSAVGFALADDNPARAQRPLADQYAALLMNGRSLEDVKLAVDHWVDPTADETNVKLEIDRLHASLKPMLAGVPTITANSKYCADFFTRRGSGTATGHSPMSILTLPGANRAASFSRATSKRLGNCVTMPMLVIILGRRMGLKMTLAMAPSHVFVKFTDAQGREWNLEATSGAGYTRDEWYRQNLPMSDDAVAKGTYLRALTDEEAAALIVSYRLERDMAEGRFEDVIEGSRHDSQALSRLCRRLDLSRLGLRWHAAARYCGPLSADQHLAARTDPLRQRALPAELGGLRPSRGTWLERARRDRKMIAQDQETLE